MVSPMSHGGKCVCARRQKPGHIIGSVLPVMIRVGARRSAAQWLPVEKEKVIVMRGDIDLCQRRLVRHHKGLSEVSIIIRVRGPVPDVMRRPLILIQSGVKVIWRTVRAWLAGLIPDANLPPEALVRGQG